MTVALKINHVDGPVNGPVDGPTDEEITDDALNKALDRIRQLDFQLLQQKNTAHNRDRAWSQHYNAKDSEYNSALKKIGILQRANHKLNGKIIEQKSRIENLKEHAKWR